MEKGKDKQIKLKFLMFENETNICWLDASIALVAHNKTFKKLVESCPESQINKIISTYNEAIATLNNFDSTVEQKVSKTREMLLDIQNSTLEHLRQFLKFKTGEPDSAFCALLNLIYQDKSHIKDHLNVSWIWRKQCSNCGTNSKSVTCLKPIITLAKVDIFHPECPSSIYMCSCKLEQEMKLIYKELPPCLIFHFEKGAGTGTNYPLTFSIKGREYQLTSIVILEKGSDPNLNHFVTWIRNPYFNMWLECNDLNTNVVSFSPVKPEFDLKDVYMYVYEAFDNLAKISNNEVSTEQEQDVENINVEVIDLSDEADNTKNTDSCYNTKASGSSKNHGISDLSQSSINYSTVKASEKEQLDDNKKDEISMQNIEICSYEKSQIGKPNIRSQIIFGSIPRLPDSISPSKHEIEAKCKNLDYQDKNDESVEVKEFKTGLIDSPDPKATDSLVENEKEIFSSPAIMYETSVTVQNLETCGKEKTEESDQSCNIESQNTSVSNFTFLNKISPHKHEIEAKNNSFDCQDKGIGESVETKEFKAEATDYSEPKITDAFVGNSNDTENTSKSVKLSPEIKSTHNSPSSSAITLDVKKNELNVCDENKLQVKMKQKPLKKNKDEFVNSRKEQKMEDISSNKEKSVGIMNDQTASTSVVDDEITKTTVRRSKRTSKSKNPDCYEKKAKINHSKNAQACDKTSDETLKQSQNDEKKNDKQNEPNKKNNETLTDIIDRVVPQSLAVFLQYILEMHNNNPVS